jgi:hypothetical protein
MELKPLNPLTYFCENGIDAADDCRCPKLNTGYPSLREWWSDAEHRRITLYMALIAAIAIAVYMYGAMSR